MIPGEAVGSDGEYVFTAELTKLQEVRDFMQGGGTVVVKFGELGTKAGMSYEDLCLLISYMERESLTEVSITSKVVTGPVKVGPLETDNDIYTFWMSAGSDKLTQTEISKDFRLRMYIPVTIGGFEFAEPLVRAWDVNTLRPVDGSSCSNGFVSFTADDTEAGFVGGSTPVKGITMPMIIVVLALIILFVLLLLRHHHKKKLRNRNKGH